MKALQVQADCLVLNVFVQPKASRDQWQGLHGTELKLAITAPPVDGKANAYVQKLLAAWFQCSKSQVELVRGLQSRHKQIQIRPPYVVPEALTLLLEP